MSATDALTHVTHPPTLMRLRDALQDPHPPILRAYERDPFRIID